MTNPTNSVSLKRKIRALVKTARKVTLGFYLNKKQNLIALALKMDPFLLKGGNNNPVRLRII